MLSAESKCSIVILKEHDPYPRAFDPHSIKLVIFDLDGTLIDSRLDLVHSVNAALRHIGRLSCPMTSSPATWATARRF